MHTVPYPKTAIALHSNGSFRSAGVHLSAILRHIALRTGILDKRYEVNDLDSENARTRFALGFAWEEWLCRHLPFVNHQPGQVWWDGIIGSPDGIDATTLTIHEFKLTWKSCATPVTEQLLWLWQVMGYCSMLGKQLGEPVTNCVIHPVYLAGDCRANRNPL